MTTLRRDCAGILWEYLSRYRWLGSRREWVTVFNRLMADWGGALLQYSGLLLRLYDTQHSEEDGVSFVLPYWRWVSSQIRHPERTNSSKDGYRTRDGKIVCNPPTSPLIYIKSTTEIKTWTLRTSSRVVTWSPVVLSLLLCLVLMKQTAGREYMQSIVQRREKRPREKNKPGGL